MPELNLTSAPANLRHGSNIGQPLTRRDGALKVTGRAMLEPWRRWTGLAVRALSDMGLASDRKSVV